MTACSDDGSSSAREVPADAEHGPGAADPRRRTPERPPDPPPRPRVVDEPGILGLSRLTRGRFGSRLFNLFFLLVFAVILIQLVSALLDHPW